MVMDPLVGISTKVPMKGAMDLTHRGFYLGTYGSSNLELAVKGKPKRRQPSQESPIMRNTHMIRVCLFVGNVSSSFFPLVLPVFKEHRRIFFFYPPIHPYVHAYMRRIFVRGDTLGAEDQAVAEQAMQETGRGVLQGPIRRQVAASHWRPRANQGLKKICLFFGEGGWGARGSWFRLLWTWI